MSIEQEIKDIYIDYLNKQKFNSAEKEYNYHIILVNGKRIITRSGKTVWKSLGAAKNALRNHLEQFRWEIKEKAQYRKIVVGIVPGGQEKELITYCSMSKALKEAEDEWIKDHVSIVPLNKYNPPPQK